MKALALFATPLLAVLVLIFSVVVMLAPTDPPTLASTTCAPTAPGAVTGVDLDREQLEVARDVITVGKELDVPSRGWVVALATGMQESGLRPLNYGDRDSIGVFQQRDAWGSHADRINPKTSARMFYTGGQAGQRGLLDIPSWPKLPVTQAAQAVQVSAFPDAYAQWEPLAIKLVEKLANVDAQCRPSGKWVFPLGEAAYTQSASFGRCSSHWANCHTGQDFAVPTGTPVMSASDGDVTFAGWAGPYGNSVHVVHANGVATWYAHLSRIETRDGARVRAGDVLGLSGSTGNSTGPHLHLEVRRHASETTSGEPTDPLAWLRRQHAL